MSSVVVLLCKSDHTEEMPSIQLENLNVMGVVGSQEGRVQTARTQPAKAKVDAVTVMNSRAKAVI